MIGFHCFFQAQYLVSFFEAQKQRFVLLVMNTFELKPQDIGASEDEICNVYDICPTTTVSETAKETTEKTTKTESTTVKPITSKDETTMVSETMDSGMMETTMMETTMMETAMMETSMKETTTVSDIDMLESELDTFAGNVYLLFGF